MVVKCSHISHIISQASGQCSVLFSTESGRHRLGEHKDRSQELSAACFVRELGLGAVKKHGSRASFVV